MRECHLKMICSENGERREETVKPCCSVVIIPGFQVHSALYGDGKERYADVTTTVQEWVSKQWWPDNWEEILYAQRKPRMVPVAADLDTVLPTDVSGNDLARPSGLMIHNASYGPNGIEIELTDVVQRLVKDDTLDIVVSNSILGVGNPFRGQRKKLYIVYSYNGGELVERTVEEKDWLIIGPVLRDGVNLLAAQTSEKYQLPRIEAPIVSDNDLRLKTADYLVRSKGDTVSVDLNTEKLRTPTALNDYLIRRFSVSPQRLRGPMPIEVPQFHRNDLAQLFAELGFKRGAEIGVAEGNYSEILMKANPTMELLCVDPWHSYSGNPQNKTKEKNEYAYNEAKRKLCQPDWRVKLIPLYSMNAVREVEENSLDFCYIDGHHSYPYVMADIIEWTKRVRSGGIVALDDIYQLNEKWGAGPMEAIYDYTRAMRINPWWLINAHKSVDGFFVKP